MGRFISGNVLTLLCNGEQYFPALEAAIESAVQTVFIETYIFRPDKAGYRIAAALKTAAKRGVAVHVLVDGFGGRDFVQQLMPDLMADGVHVLIYRREIKRFSINRHRLRRLHRKLAVIDERIAFVGGINIVDDFDSSNLKAPRHDYAVRVEGPLLKQISAAVQHMWLLVSWVSLQRRARLPKIYQVRMGAQGHVRAAFLVRDNLLHRHDIENAYLTAIQQAQREIIIACAYFFPGRRFRQALVAAAERGVRVLLLLQGMSDHPLLAYATRASYPLYLQHRIRLYEYDLSYLHAKVAVIDRQWATVGSSNIDAFSFLLAREANVVVDDVVFAGQLRIRLLQAIRKGARRLKREDWRRLSWVQRSVAWMAYYLVRILIEVAGYGRERN